MNGSFELPEGQVLFVASDNTSLCRDDVYYYLNGRHDNPWQLYNTKPYSIKICSGQDVNKGILQFKDEERCLQYVNTYLSVDYQNDGIERTSIYAATHHQRMNRLYWDLPYSVHLQMVYQIVKLFGPLYFETQECIDIQKGAWGHDLEEDTDLNYNDYEKVLGHEVAEIIYCCSNEKGRNRAERQNGKFYAELCTNRKAVFVKLCDRLANVYFSAAKKSRQLEIYRQEHAVMKKKLGGFGFDAVMRELDSIFEKTKNVIYE